MSIEKIRIKDRGAVEEMTRGRAVDTVAHTIAEAEDNSWAIASHDDRTRYLNVATAVVDRHVPRLDEA